MRSWEVRLRVFFCFQRYSPSRTDHLPSLASGAVPTLNKTYPANFHSIKSEGSGLVNQNQPFLGVLRTHIWESDKFRNIKMLPSSACCKKSCETLYFDFVQFQTILLAAWSKSRNVNCKYVNLRIYDKMETLILGLCWTVRGGEIEWSHFNDRGLCGAGMM